MPKLTDNRKICLSCAQSPDRQGEVKPNENVDYTLGRCDFCRSEHHIVYPMSCWEWPASVAKEVSSR